MFATDIRRFARFGAFGLVLCITTSNHAMAEAGAGVLSINGSGGPGATVVMGGGNAATSANPLAPTVLPIAPSGPVPLTGFSTYQPANHNAPAGSSADSSDSHGVDEKWGDPLNAGVYDSDTMHAGFNYYYGNAQGQSQGGVGFSLTFKN